MTTANDLIERMESETGQRIDSNDGDNLAMMGLVGAISRMMGNSPDSYTEEDDVMAGIVLTQEKETEATLAASLLDAGIPSADVAELLDTLND